MSIKTELYERWSATAEAAATSLAKSYSISEATAATHKKVAFEDGARILHEADGVDHLKKSLRERMGDKAMYSRRDHYARMLNDVETALERGDETKAVADADRA